MSGSVVLPFDPSRRRRRTTASCVTAADRARADAHRALAELEEARAAIRERLPHVVDGSQLRVDLLLDLVTIHEDIEAIERLLAPAEVVSIGGRRHG
jgi:hypothetical protein